MCDLSCFDTYSCTDITLHIFLGGLQAKYKTSAVEWASPIEEYNWITYEMVPKYIKVRDIAKFTTHPINPKHTYTLTH